MKIRTIKSHEIAKFAELSPNPARLQSRLEVFFKEKASNLESLFVAERDDEFISGVIYLLYPSVPDEINLWDVFLPIAEGDSDVGRELLAESFHMLGQRGVRRIEARIESLDDDFESRCSCVESAGMKIFQQKWRYEFTAGTNLPEIQSTLIFKSLIEYGDAAYLNLIENVTRNTLDRGDRVNKLNMGSRRAAECYYSILKNLDDRPEFWQVGLTSSGEVVGLIVPQIFSPELGGINYIGVVPEKRGMGFGLELLRRGTALLLDAGINLIIGDIDTLNFPIAKSLEAVGYVRKCEIVCYGRDQG